MTSNDPLEDELLDLSRASDEAESEPKRDESNRNRGQPPSTPNASGKHFDDDALLDVPKLKQDPSDTAALPSKEEEPAPRRPLPGIIDVFLYPFGRAGVVTLSIMFGVPFALVIFALACIWMCRAAPLLLLVAVPVVMAGGIVAVGMVLYLGWYVCECVRDSAAGGIRAPDTMGMTPGIMEMFVQNFQVLVCVGVCLGLYSSTAHHLPTGKGISWIITGIISFLFPMTLLRVIMLESLQGLFPLMTLRLIGRTCIHYIILLLALCVLPSLGYLLLRNMMGWPLLALGIVFGLYASLVSAHLLGRFAWHCEDRLQWE